MSVFASIYIKSKLQKWNYFPILRAFYKQLITAIVAKTKDITGPIDIDPDVVPSFAVVVTSSPAIVVEVPPSVDV